MGWLIRLFLLLSDRSRGLFVWFVGVSLAAAAAELFGLGLVLVLVRSLAGEGSSRIIDAIAQYISLVAPSRPYAREINILLFLFIAYALRMAIGLYQSSLRNVMVMGIHNELIGRLFRSVVTQPYERRVERETAGALELLNNTGARVARNLSNALLICVTELALVTVLLGFMMIQQPGTTLLSLAGITIVYLVGHGVTRPGLERNGRIERGIYSAYDRMVLETMRGFRELVVYGGVRGAIDRHGKLLEQRAAVQRSNRLLTEVPRILIETGVVYVALVVILVFLLRGVPPAEFTQQLALVAVVVVRVLPAFNRLATATSQIREGRSAAEEVLRRLEAAPAGDEMTPALPAPRLQRKLELDNVTFTWPGSDRPAVDGVSFTIAKGEVVGVIGTTGSGKTTLVELLIGLLTPSQGVIRIDDTVLTKDLARSWHTRAGYAAQDVYLSDNSIAANIAFGRSDPATARAEVETAGRLASLDSVVAALPKGWDSTVGEHGGQLSGGQRQRIGIARALFARPDLLILDEATSALDIHTEREVGLVVERLKGDTTIVVVAHRLSTLAPCDRVLWLEHGRVRALGTYDHVVSKFVGDGADARAAGSRMSERRQLLLPVEVAPRELKAKLLLAASAAAEGWRVYIGEPGAVQLLAQQLDRSVYLEKNINPRRVPLFKSLSAAGHEIIAWDEEGLAVLDYDWYVTKNIKRDMLGHVGAFMCWGDDERDAIAAHHPDHAARLVVTGNPRGDLLRPEWRPLLDDDAEVYRRRYGNYILIVSSFSRVNRYLGGTREDFVRTIQRSFELPDEKLDFLRGSLSHCESIFEGFRDFLPRLAKSFPDHTIVIRPHPAERHETWTEAAKGLGNVAITFEGEATGWIAGAGAILHNGCTTAVEAFASGRLPICYRPVVSAAYDVDLPNALSLPADDATELIETIRRELGLDRTKDSCRAVYQERLPRLRRAMATAGQQSATGAILELINGLSIPAVRLDPEAVSRVQGALVRDHRRVAQGQFVSMAKRAVSSMLRGERMVSSDASYKAQKLTGFDEETVRSFLIRIASLRPGLSAVRGTNVAHQLYRIDAD